MFRGREMQHPELGRRILDRVAEEVADVGKVEAHPKQDGRNMTMVLGPDKKAQEKARKDAVAAEAPDAADAAEPVSADAPTPGDGAATSERPSQDDRPATEPAPTTDPAPVESN
jgi:translation initiation factor IF-3